MLIKLCSECNGSISEKRLQAIPNTTKCIVCQSKSDVYIKRFDDSAKDGEIQVSSFYFKNTRFETAISHLNGTEPYDDMGYTDQPSMIKPIIYNGLPDIFVEDLL